MSDARAERRRRTEERILDAARALFGELGFERTTIRAVAARAEVDPALVMQYFTNKQLLFSKAARVSSYQLPTDDQDRLVDLLVSTVGVKLGGVPDSSLAMLRSMLTHPDAAEIARDVLDGQVSQITEAISAHAPEDTARVRAALVITTMIGVTIGQQLLDIEALRGVGADQLAEALRPALHALITPAK